VERLGAYRRDRSIIYSSHHTSQAMTYPKTHSSFWNRSLQRWGLVLASAGTIALQMGSLPALAGDPFRPNAPHRIEDSTEAAFYAIFRDGNYVEAEAILANARDRSDPMFHAMAAALAYLDKDWEGLRTNATRTQQTAESIISQDPLRGNLYSAVGIFLEGAYVLQTQGARGTPTALGMLQKVFDRLDEAERINPQDPELSLIKGFMDLLLAVNLPFANPERAIQRLNTYGYPVYVAQRGIAIGYRDLGENENALQAVDAALAAAPNNPDLLYLKAQILRRLGRNSESISFFAQALEYAEQMPEATVRQITFEQCLSQGKNPPTCAASAGL
jgi:tetratricopeptide (TPR) repeat protein